jgi:hypothetical protein
LHGVERVQLRAECRKRGVDEIVGNKKRSEDSSVSFGIGAVLFGIVGIVLIASGGSRPEASPPPAVVVREAPPQNPPSDSIAQRLTSLKGLHDGGLITDDEYQSRRQRLLDEA